MKMNRYLFSTLLHPILITNEISHSRSVAFNSRAVHWLEPEIEEIISFICKDLWLEMIFIYVLIWNLWRKLFISLLVSSLFILLCITIVCKVCKINYIDPMIRIKCWVSFQEETKLRLTELIVYFIGGIVCQDDKLGVCVQQPSKCHIKCVKTDSRGCKPGTIKRDFTPIWFVSACGMSAKLSPLIELTPGEWENGINGHGALCLRTIIIAIWGVCAWNNGKSGALWCVADFPKISSSTTR